MTPRIRAAAPHGAPPSSFGPNGGQLFSAVTALHLSTSRCCSACNSLHNNSWGPTSSQADPSTVTPSTTSPQTLRTFSSGFSWILSHQRSQTGPRSGSQRIPEHPATHYRSSSMGCENLITDINWEIRSPFSFPLGKFDWQRWENSIIPKLSINSGGLRRSCCRWWMHQITAAAFTSLHIKQFTTRWRCSTSDKFYSMARPAAEAFFRQCLEMFKWNNTIQIYCIVIEVVEARWADFGRFVFNLLDLESELIPIKMFINHSFTRKSVCVRGVFTTKKSLN